MYVVKKFLHSDKTINIVGLVLIGVCIFAAVRFRYWTSTFTVDDGMSGSYLYAQMLLRAVAYLMVWVIVLIFGVRLSFYSSEKK
ncbi:hypothetical protein [Schleiferilactobacillus perolens]|jgi:hypothetical protein|uniref:Uncharacterized protein n=1 Tax=Schleiferilactobacillus perolens DSM 12744 TaxID=1423792 RepID=A0A0R1N8S6_9LACO|nr:hypothetical protein [Schleiferilactobacillus perolens]KRL13307.1 hypothetical protein FD09_GL002134 [Schleiferilactobacillus perolens DSM 12744]MCI2171465.1 hypothetical protein [Schleiferilactobacillus perolens]